MTITKRDRFALLPKRCDCCNRLFWLEQHDVFYKAVGIDYFSLRQTRCKECVAMREREEAIEAWNRRVNEERA